MTPAPGVRVGPSPRPDLDGLPGYSSARPGPVPVRVRASSNEAPGPAPEELVTAATAALRDAGRYPRLHGADLVEALAASYGVPADHVAVGDGALSLLDRILLTFVRPGDPVVMGWRSYEAYPLSTRVAGGRPVLVDLAADGTHDLERMGEAVAAGARVVIVCNPNNPTGTAVGWLALEAFLDRIPPDVVVVLDEAYVEYSELAGSGRPALGDLLARRNVVVLRTFSKAHGLAGLRAGYALAAPDIVTAVRAASPPFPVSTPATAAAICSLSHPEWVTQRVATARAERARVTALLGDHGLPVLPSQANFVWTALGSQATAFAELAASHGVLLRAFAGEGVRITVGDPHLADALEPVLDAWSPR